MYKKKNLTIEVGSKLFDSFASSLSEIRDEFELTTNRTKLLYSKFLFVRNNDSKSIDNHYTNVNAECLVVYKYCYLSNSNRILFNGFRVSFVERQI